jgi:hypothetical protein
MVESLIMDPKMLSLLPGLAACQTWHREATLHSLTAAVPVYEWPVRQELPEKTDPPHGEGSGESVMFVGNTYVVTNGSGRLISADSGASGSPSIPSATWLPNGLNLVTTVSELDVEPVPLSPLPKGMIHIGPDTRSQFANPSAVQARRWYTRRRG